MNSQPYHDHGTTLPNGPLLVSNLVDAQMGPSKIEDS